MAQQGRLTGGDATPFWNQNEVSRCLLPVLHLIDPTKEDEARPVQARQREAQAACLSRPEVYRQLLLVYESSSDEIFARWFGWIDCSEEVLAEVFEFIRAALEGGVTRREERRISIEKDTYFANLFHITDGDRAVDLSAPFAQYYFCDERLCRDHKSRRMALEEECRTLITRYRLYYHRIRAWYREQGERECPLSAEHHTYMQLYDYLVARMAYEEKIREDRRALEYEREGLGWFHRDRKRSIAKELHELELAELAMLLEDARARYDAYAEQLEEQRDAWEKELERVPLTAFGRRRELKQKLAQLQADLEEEYRRLRIDELQEQYRKLKKQGK